MVKCFKCDAEISYLNAYSEIVHTFEIGTDGEPNVFGGDHIEGYTGFECPECREELNFLSEADAVKFLKTKSEGK